MSPDAVATWMYSCLVRDGCLYQDDVVDYLVKSDQEGLLIENAGGNQVLSRPILTAFLRRTEGVVVWVRSERYWRWRVSEDEDGREARG